MQQVKKLLLTETCIRSSEGRTETTGELVFTVSVDATTGEVTLDQKRALTHPDATNHDDEVSLTADDLVTLTRTDILTDNDGDEATDSESIDIGKNLLFKDDGPAVDVKKTNITGPTLTVDETDLTVDAKASFAGMFTVMSSDAGADGEDTSKSSTKYTLDVKANGADSGLVDVATGEKVVLTENASGVIEGRTETGGVLVFTVSVNETTAEVTLDQQRALKHPDATDHNDEVSLSADDLVTLTRTDVITDNDGDTAEDSATLDIGKNLVFKDDGPTVDIYSKNEERVILKTDDVDTKGSNSDTDSTSYNFSAVFYQSGTSSQNAGADGLGKTETEYKLEAVNGTDSGLTSQGVAITLSLVNGEVIGTAGSTEVFKVSVDANGVVTLKQSETIDHVDENADGDATNNDAKLATLTDNLIKLSATLTVTDKDGDSASDTETINIGSNLQFTDDTPDASTTDLDVRVNVDPIITNLTIVLDVSGSMSGQKLEIQKTAAQNLIEEYSKLGQVNVKIVTFNAGSSSEAWITDNVQGAKDAIDDITVASGSTNYEAALDEVMTTYDTAGDPEPSSTQDVFYFLSDGVPTAGDADNNIDDWKDFANAEFDDVFVIGMGTGADLDGNDRGSLEDISGVVGDADTTGHPAQTVTDFSDLSDTLISTVNTNVTVTHTGGTNTLDYDFGADGPADGTGINPDADKLSFVWGTATGTDSNGAALALTWEVSSDGKTLTGKDGTDTVIKIEANLTTKTYDITEISPTLDVATLDIPFTVTDADGDSTSSNVTIDIETDSNPAILGDTNTVYEKGLDDSSDNSEIASGKFKVTSPDGIATLTVAGTVFTEAELIATNTTPSSPIDTVEGLLVITSYDETTGEVSYEYTLKDNLDHTTPNDVELFDNITLEVKDPDGDTTNGTLKIKIVDDVPVANADENSIDENTLSVSGNVVTGGSTNDVADDSGADKHGVNDTVVVGVEFGSTVGTVGSEIQGLYGKLILNADGSYTYELDNTNAAVDALTDGDKLEEVFNYTIEDKDGDQDSTTLKITINGKTDALSIDVENTQVDEDFIPNVGNETNPDTDAIANQNVDTGDITTIGADTIVFKDGQTTSLTSEGDSIDLVYSNSDKTITGMANGEAVFVATIAADGKSYTFELKGQVDHPVMNSEDTVNLPLVIEVSNSEKTITDTLNVTIADDIPSAADASATIDLNPDPVNLVFTLDVSGSMGEEVSGTGKDRLTIAKEAMEDLVAEYKNLGHDVLVQVNTFSTTASGTGAWMTASELETFLNTLSDGGWTNYEDALQTTEANYSVSPNGGKTYAYFLSDGNPTVEMDDSTATADDVTAGNVQDGIDDFIDTSYENSWNAFVNNPTNNIAGTYAVGIGTNVSTAYLSQVSSNVIEVDDPADLSTTLQNTVVFETGSLDFNFGADGAADGTNVKLDGDKLAFTWETPTATDVNGAAVAVVWTISANGTEVIGKIAGETVVKLEAKDILSNNPVYEITQLDKDSGIVDIKVPYTVTDGDGDSVTANLNIDVVVPVNDTPTIDIAGTVNVDEDKLIDTADTDGYANNEIVTKSLNADFGNDGAGTIEFVSGQTTDLTSQGKDITIQLSNNGQTMTGVSSDGRDVFTIELDVANDTYTYKLLDVVDHPQMDVEDRIDNNTFDMHYEVKITDADGDFETDSIKVKIADDIAESDDTCLTIHTNALENPVNLVFTLDISGSMDSTVSNGNSRLDIATDATIDLINEYVNNNQDVMVQINTFSTSADSVNIAGNADGWMTASQAITYLNSLNDGNGYTNFEHALAVTEDNYETGTVPNPGAESYMYFLTDGNPNRGINLNGDDVEVDANGNPVIVNEGPIDAASQAKWEAFAATFDDVYAIDIGGSIDTDKLSPITLTDDSDHILDVSDINNLPQVLVNTATPKVFEGQLDFTFGADGAADGTGVKLDGDKLAFTWNTNDIKVNGVTNAAIIWTVSANGLEIVGKDAADKVVAKLEAQDIESNNPTYEISKLAPNSGIDSIELPFTVSDADGDTATSNVKVVIVETDSLSIDIEIGDPTVCPSNCPDPIGIWKLGSEGALSGNTNGEISDNTDISYHGGYKLNQLGMDGSSNTATQFWNSGSGYGQISDEASFHTENGTVSFWFDDENSIHDCDLFTKDASGTNEGDLTIRTLSDARIEVKLIDNNGNAHTITTAAGVFGTSGNEWHHVSFTFGDEGMKLYYDGALVGTDSYTGGLENNTADIKIGKNFSGDMDDVSLYGCELSADMIHDMYTTKNDIIQNTGSTGYTYPVTIDVDLIDTDNSSANTVSDITLSNVPNDGILSAGTKNADGTWTLDDTQLTDLTLTMPDATTPDFDITATVSFTNSTTGEDVIAIDNSIIENYAASDDDTIDLTSAINNNKADVIDMTNGESNTLKLDLQDIVDLDDSGNAEKELKIFGENGDEIVLEGGDAAWDKAGTETINGETFNVYKGGTAGTSNIKVLIDEDVSVDPDL